MKLTPELTKGLFGIEIEEHRVDINSKTISQIKHNHELGDRRTQPYFQTDFSESMEELVTAPQDTVKKSHQQLHNLQKILQLKLTKQEIIWPFSMPPKMNQADVDFLENHFERYWYVDYRKTLIQKYGLFQHIMCGIHVSYSPNEEIILNYQQEKQISDYQTAKNELLFMIARQLTGYRWLITYLFGSSIQDFNENDNIPTEIKHKHPFVKSWRSSKYGFANQQDIDVSYDNFADFETSLNEYIQNGTLFAKSEFYGPVRLKTLKGHAETQIDYLEFRMLDNDPFSAEGLDRRTLYFIHLLIIDVLVNQNHWSKLELQENRNYNNVVALSEPNQALNEEYAFKANQLFKRLKVIANEIDNPEYQSTITWIEAMLKNPNETIAGRLFKIKAGEQLGLELGMKYKKFFQDSPFINVPTPVISLYQSALCQGDLVKEMTDNSITVETQNGEIQKREIK
ncbi:glutamate--cysteine ligase [Fructilactobacillus frigidiflavus]|uniref:glutamate--cysteine ligase n=1 Tax=Fructilactobacillus frigidiflavus TaxID=3242688 RepID=UPI003756F095